MLGDVSAKRGSAAVVSHAVGLAAAIADAEAYVLSSWRGTVCTQDAYGNRLTCQGVASYLHDQHARTTEVLRNVLHSCHGGRIAEAGPAFGVTLLTLSRHFGFEVEGYELPANIDAYCRALIESGIPVTPYDVAQPAPSEGTVQLCDLLVFSEVLEHLLVDVCPVVERLAGLVKPGGRLLLTTPNTYRYGNWVRVKMGYNAAERHPADFAARGNSAVDRRVHPREYTMFEVAHALAGSDAWRLLRVWTWSPPLDGARRYRDALRRLWYRALLRLPMGDVTFAVAEKK